MESSTILTLLHYSRGFNHWSLLLEKRKKGRKMRKKQGGIKLGCSALQFQNEALLEVSVDVSSAFILHKPQQGQNHEKLMQVYCAC